MQYYKIIIWIWQVRKDYKMAGHKSIKRIIHRCAEEVDATRRIAKVTSLKEGFETFRAKVDIQIMNRNGYYENETRKNTAYDLKRDPSDLSGRRLGSSNLLQLFDRKIL